MTNNAIARTDEKDIDTAMGKAALAAGPGVALERISTPFQTALRVQVPRDIMAVDKASLSEATVMGEDFFYSWEVTEKSTGKKKLVCDVSIDGAMALLRNWRNSVCLPELIETTPKQWTFRAAFIDLESGTTAIRLFRQTRFPAPGKYDQERWEDMEFQKGQSKAIRNAVLAGIPGWLQKKCLKAARAAAEKTLRPSGEVQALIDRSRTLGVQRAQIEERFGKPVEQLSSQELVDWRALLRTVEDDLQNDAPQDQPSNRSETETLFRKSDSDQTESKFGERITSALDMGELEYIGQQISQAFHGGKINDAERGRLAQAYVRRREALQSAG